MNETQLIELLKEQIRMEADLAGEAERADVALADAERRASDAWTRVNSARGEAQHTKKRLMAVIRGVADPGPMDTK